MAPKNYSALGWQSLVEAIPELAAVEADIKALARATEGDSAFCANDAWYGYEHYKGFKGRVERLVGWERESADPLDALNNAWLYTPAVYDLAYQHLYELLPDCRGACSCLVVGSI